jgi:hypothetical protein
MSTNSFFNWLRAVPGALKRTLIDAASEIGAWLAPLPSAVSVANAAHRHLGYEPWLAFVVGAIVELLGFATTNRAADLWEYNQTRRADEPKAPFWLAGVLVVLYVVSTIALSVIADLATGVVHLLPAIFPIMALTGTINVALGRQQARRVEHNRQAAEARRLADEQAKADQLRQAEIARAEAERLRQEEKAEREARRLERKARQETRHQTRHVATDVAIDRDTFVRLFTTQDYADVADLAHSLGFNGELQSFYTGGRRSVSRLSRLVGVHPRTGQRWIDDTVASTVAPDDATNENQQ